jgi:ribonuclease HI
MYQIYTDGGCKANGKNDAIGGIGIAVYKNSQEIYTYNQAFTHTTNNRMEYRALIQAMRLVIEKKWENVIFFSDSQLLIKTVNEWIYGWQKNNWRKNGKGSATKIKNLDLVLQIWELKLNLPKSIKFSWVKAHNGDIGNEKADELTNILDGSLLLDETDDKIITRYGVIANMASR